jgi:hypothetical protein
LQQLSVVNEGGFPGMVNAESRAEVLSKRAMW